MEDRNIKKQDTTVFKPLTLRQEAFCQYYSSPTSLFGNGTASYKKAYALPGKFMSDTHAATKASTLLKNQSVLERIKELVDFRFSKEFVDGELAFVIAQREELPAKVAAIREYNRLQKRVDDGARVLVGISLTDLFDRSQKPDKTQKEAIEG